MTGISSYIAQNTFLLLTITALFGLIVGSFLNVVIYRLPIMMKNEWTEQCHDFLDARPEKNNTIEKFNLAEPDSTCPHCGHKITAFENIPLLSYLFLRGKCSNCKNAISLRYPMIELLTAVLSIVVVSHFGYSYQALFALILTWALIALTFIDIDEQLLPDSITLPFLWLGLLLSISSLFTDMQSSIIGAAAGYLSLWSVYQIFKLVTGKEGMGFGDFKLLGLFGAWFGYQALPLIILLSACVGTVFAVGLIIFKGHNRENPIPFGPYLAMAGWIAMIWGNQITTAYLTWANVI